MKQGDVDLVNEFVCCYVTARIPKSRFQRILLVHFASFIQNISPSSFAFWMTRDVENWNLVWPSENCFSVNISTRFFTYFCVVLATFFVIPMMPLMAKSTGMHSPLSSPLQRSVRRTPLAAAILMMKNGLFKDLRDI